ncbi:hypothetical protein ARAM_000353 [Aspergillus rambellii]|uniref:F-box domain-containing protein n=1 Tax=Aspergillus rambellii TaxID=308745 RepID=A0A0F8XTE6_9EURO|nr:hypothetical protein ARAM_000353 [Aspergillus rambellii]
MDNSHESGGEQHRLLSLPDLESKTVQNLNTPLLQLPPELLSQILSYLSAPHLACVSGVCRSLAEHAQNDLLWANLVNAYLPEPIHDPGVFDSFRSLYLAHYPCWFIPRSKVWFSDTEHTGNLIIARYDHRRGVIEAYRVIAERPPHKFQIWEYNPDKGQSSQTRYLDGESRMRMPVEVQHVFNAFSLCCPSTSQILDANTQWPPPSIPSEHRVYRDAEVHWSEWNRHPRRLEKMSECAFRIRRWAHFRLGMPIFTAGRSETLSTYATLDPSLYTPTKEKPYQGIWVGDYSAHGCEFLLFMQRGKDGDNLSELEAENQGIIQKGSLEAVKLTGDPNVPRGQISFMSDDIGPGGTVRIADEEIFKGGRVVRSKGHLAGLGFRDDTFINSQLILVSTDCVAHYWESMGHISYFRRLDIDALIHT